MRVKKILRNNILDNNIEKILLNNEGIVASGIYYPWAEKLIDYFDLLIVVLDFCFIPQPLQP